MALRGLKRIGLLTVFGTLLATGVGLSFNAAQAATSAAHPMAIVSAAHRAKFGTILVNSRGIALYTWKAEKNGMVECTGQCAKIWPPLLLMKGQVAPMHVAGVMGAFGVVMRPGGGRQLTFNHHPL